MNYKINDLGQLQEFAVVLSKIIESKNIKFVLLCGTVGIGKTTLAKFVMESIGHDDEVRSPTFNIVNEYNIGGKVVFHIDLYRLEENQFEFLQEYIQDGDLLIIEWADSVIDKFDNKITVKVKMDINEDIRIAEVE
jgi:tRNA threonylcarbamoyladenosine biosynthesis protein TsaE